MMGIEEKRINRVTEYYLYGEILEGNLSGLNVLNLTRNINEM